MPTLGREMSFLLLLYFAGTTYANDPLVVEITQGKLRGFKATSRSGIQFFSFTNIPFAKPPIGALRFQPPQEPEPWRGVRNATDLGPWCIQYNMYELRPSVFGVEDCLYLAVYTRNLLLQYIQCSSRMYQVTSSRWDIPWDERKFNFCPYNDNRKYALMLKTRGSAPVMVHLHGGGFISGNGPHKTDPRYFMDEDVVIVDINYRVGIMGFLSFEDKVMPGNQGLKDQVMALRWVKKNIAHFGGDPNKVTLVGESAGAGSVYHHTVSPLSRGLFHGGIAESGSSYNLWCLMPPGLAKERAERLASLVSCPQKNSKDSVACLIEKNAEELVGHIEDFRVWQIDPLILFLPVLEPPAPGSFLSGPVSRWQHNPVPLLMGTTSGEGLLRTEYFILYNMDFNWYNDHFQNVAPISLQYFRSSSDPDDVTNKIRKYYFGSRKISMADWVNLTNAYTDSWFTAGIFDAANLHSGDVYFYYFDYRGEFSFFSGEGNRSSLAFGAGHTEEIIYLWYNKNFAGNLKGNDLELSKKIVKIWTDFAKHGKAIPPTRSGNWEKWTSKNHRYMDITKSGFKPREGLHEDRYKFWSELNYRDLYPIS